MQLEVGQILEGRVTGITKFGAFVALPEGKSGLVHISEVANAYVTDVQEFLQEGQTVRVRVMSISPEGKIALSVKRAAEEGRPAPRAAAPRRGEGRPVPRPPADVPADGYVPRRSGDQGFEDKLKQFMQESDSKMSGNRMFEHQRRSRGRRK